MAASDVENDPALGLLRVLGEGSSAASSFSVDLLSDMYRHMRRVRALDQRMTELQRQGQIGSYIPSLGQEAVPVAAALATEKTDWMFPALRESSVLLVRGYPLERYLAQIFGTDRDVSKGRQMPGHVAAHEVNVVSWSTAVASQLPQAVGAAWAAKKKGDALVVVAFVGEGGTSEADFHSAMNFAGVFRVPCIFICQNNHWAASTPSTRQTASQTFAVKAKAYGMPGVRVDGNDPLAMHACVSDARVHALAGAGPVFIEALTYRMGVHSTADDPTRYQPEEELRTWSERDPIQRLRAHLLERGALSAKADDAIDSALEAELSEAIRRVEEHPRPKAPSLFDDVYAERTWNLDEELSELERIS